MRSWIEPTKFWVADMGSAFGTYVRIRSTQGNLLEEGQTYLMGADTMLNITQVNNQVMIRGSKPKLLILFILNRYALLSQTTKNFFAGSVLKKQQRIVKSMGSINQKRNYWIPWF